MYMNFAKIVWTTGQTPDKPLFFNASSGCPVKKTDWTRLDNWTDWTKRKTADLKSAAIVVNQGNRAILSSFFSSNLSSCFSDLSVNLIPL